MAKKQSLAGICFAGVQKLTTQNQGPSEMTYLTWMGMAGKIQQRNEAVSKAIGKVKERYEKIGFDMVLLKGQGNLCNFPEHLKSLRTPGDIDIWLMPKNNVNVTTKEMLKNDQIVLRYFWKKDPSIRHCYIHIHDAQIEGIDVEVHYRPSFINSPWRNRKFQHWMAEKASEQSTNIVSLPGSSTVQVAAPTTSFNLIYQLNHMYRHIFDDGLGIRQIMDYYFLLLQEITYDDTKSLKEEIDMFGMERFAGALMYVMQVVFGLPISKMMTPPDEKSGKFLLTEIMQSGNFGHYDERLKIVKHENGVQRIIRRQKRNMRFFSQYAEEVICVPFFRVYQEYWRMKMILKCK